MFVAENKKEMSYQPKQLLNHLQIALEEFSRINLVSENLNVLASFKPGFIFSILKNYLNPFLFKGLVQDPEFIKQSQIVFPNSQDLADFIGNSVPDNSTSNYKILGVDLCERLKDYFTSDPINKQAEPLKDFISFKEYHPPHKLKKQFIVVMAFHECNHFPSLVDSVLSTIEVTELIDTKIVAGAASNSLLKMALIQINFQKKRKPLEYNKD
jgi:hypothetical protein